jgi:hypothetical protein
MRSEGRKLVVSLPQVAGEDAADHLDLGIVVSLERGEDVIDLCASGVRRQAALEGSIVGARLATSLQCTDGPADNEPKADEPERTAWVVAIALGGQVVAGGVVGTEAAQGGGARLELCHGGSFVLRAMWWSSTITPRRSRCPTVETKDSQQSRF